MSHLPGLLLAMQSTLQTLMDNWQQAQEAATRLPAFFDVFQTRAGYYSTAQMTLEHMPHDYQSNVSEQYNIKSGCNHVGSAHLKLLYIKWPEETWS